MRFYEALNGNIGLHFETRVSALNNALGIDRERQRPVGTLQLAGPSSIEIDQVPEHIAARPIIDELPAGLAIVSFVATKGMPRPPGVNWHEHRDPRWPTAAVALLQGSAGEWVEFVTPSGGVPTNCAAHPSPTDRHGEYRTNHTGERT